MHFNTAVSLVCSAGYEKNNSPSDCIKTSHVAHSKTHSSIHYGSCIQSRIPGIQTKNLREKDKKASEMNNRNRNEKWMLAKPQT